MFSPSKVYTADTMVVEGNISSAVFADVADVLQGVNYDAVDGDNHAGLNVGSPVLISAFPSDSVRTLFYSAGNETLASDKFVQYGISMALPSGSAIDGTDYHTWLVHIIGSFDFTGGAPLIQPFIGYSEDNVTVLASSASWTGAAVTAGLNRCLITFLPFDVLAFRGTDTNADVQFSMNKQLVIHKRAFADNFGLLKQMIFGVRVSNTGGAANVNFDLDISAVRWKSSFLQFDPNM